MTKPDRLVTVPEGTDLETAKSLMHQHRLERVLVVNGDMELRGLITVKDILKSTEHPLASKDDLGRLRAGAAVGTGGDTEERVDALVAAGVDVIVVDTSHGHSQGVLERVQWIQAKYPAGAGDRRQRRLGGRREGARRSRRRRRQGRRRSGLDLHDAHRRRRGRAADLRHPVRDRRRGHGRRSGDRRRRHPLFGRHRQGDRRRRIVRDAGQPARGHRGGARRHRALPGPLVQELPRHGVARRDARRQCRPLLPGLRRRGRRGKARARRASRDACRTKACWRRSFTS